MYIESKESNTTWTKLIAEKVILNAIDNFYFPGHLNKIEN